MDMPSERKPHLKPTPLLGGAAIFPAFILAMLLNGLFDRRVFSVMAASSLVFAVSLVDDAREVSVSLKLLVQVAATAIVMSAGIMFHIFPYNIPGLAVNIILTFVWIIGITNALNFLDGLDGLAAGLAAIMAFFVALVAFQTDQPFLGWFALAIMGPCLGFLPFNFRHDGPGKIFLGDAGSAFLGFILGSLAIMGEWADNNFVVSYSVPLLIFGILVYDMIETTIRRVATGAVTNFKEWLNYTAQDHIHHRVERLLHSKKKSVFLIYAISVCLGISAVVLRKASTVDALLVVLQAIILLALITILEISGRNHQA
jgi:UDP-GlcNAc:undecaprenyl-phosphate GlcNAc-1-phosphate transferase